MQKYLPSDNLPAKPPVVLSSKGGSGTLKSTENISSSRVTHYDYENKFSKEEIIDNRNVEKIQQEDIQVISNSVSETEFQKTMNRRDREAEIRGRKALQKEKVHREYKELLKKLPVLQKQERINNIFSDKPEFHMSEERLKEVEEKRQNQMENAYEKLFPPEPRRAIITLPPKPKQKPDDTFLPFKTVDISENPPSLNLASWDVDHKQYSKATESSNEKKSESCLCHNKQEAELKELLNKLKAQKALLLQEIESLPKDSNLDELVKDLSNLSERSERNTSVKKGKRRREHCKCNASATESDSKKKLEQKFEEWKERHKNCHTDSNSSGSSLSPTPAKKAKLKTKKQLLILQNTSTQTTPKSAKESEEDENKKTGNAERPSSGCSCGCKKNIKSTEESKKKDTTEKSTSPLGTSAIEIMKSKADADKTRKICNCNKNVKAKEESKKKDTTEKSTSPLRTSAVEIIKPKDNADETHRTCNCNKNLKAKEDKVCEIVIKIRDNESEPEIKISPRKDADKVIMRRSKSQEKIQEKEKPEKVQENLHSQSKTVNIKEHTTIKPKQAERIRSISVKEKDGAVQKTRKATWREQFSQNTKDLASSSTSYYSPPDFKNQQNDNKKQKPRFRQALQEKPQQTNISCNNSSDSSTKQINPCVMKYIEKLLTMSHGTVEDLTVSSVSEVSTPTQSIIETASNNPISQLRSIMKTFDISLVDLQRHFNYSREGSQIHQNTLETLAISSSSTNSGYDGGKSKTLCSSENFSTSSTLSNKDPRELSLEDYSKQNYPKVMSKYAAVAETCNKRINDLTAMIAKVRQEKRKMMMTPESCASDKENSTAYLELPETRKENKADISNDSSKEQEELNLKLLSVDYKLATKLKKPSPEKHKSVREHMEKAITDAPSANDDVDHDIMTRFRKLLEVDKQNDKLPESKIEKQKDAFVPLLLDIPKLPKLTVPDESLTYTDAKKKKPPPAKGLLVAKKFNENIATVPHELSTIQEADSQLSARLQKNDKIPEKGPEQQSKSSDGSIPDILAELIRNAKSDQDKKSPKGTSRRSNEKSSRELQKLTSSESSTDKSSEMENIENMLRKMGMGWAVATLRKTQEALALTSSSSSLDISIKHKEVKVTESSSSEVSLKEFLGKQLYAKITSSTNDSSLSSFMKEFQDISAIQGLSSTNRDKTSHRTSTPVLTSKSIEKAEDDNLGSGFVGESDLSSVRSHEQSSRKEKQS